MKHPTRSIAINDNRRRFLKRAAGIAGGAVFAASTNVFTTFNAFARQNPPNGCPTPPSGGTPFSPGMDTRPVTLRKSISRLSSAELTVLNQAFAALRALPATDKRTWVLEADLHALYCEQCSNFTTQIHGSWSFFPWHRAYLYYYERILGSLVGDITNFRLPYWDWENIRSMPSPYTTPSDAGNALWDGNRDTTLGNQGQLPTNDGTSARIAILNQLTDFADFGGSAGLGGAVESDPHNIIHTDIGEKGNNSIDMGNLGFAARDPIFFAHHCNIDFIWSVWNSLSALLGAPAGAYQNPTDSAFLNASWLFYDENQQVVSMSAANVLDHANNLRYIYVQEPPVIRLPPLMLSIECQLVLHLPGPDPGPLTAGPFLQVSEEVRSNLLESAATLTNASSVVLVLRGVEIPTNITTGNFDVFAVKGSQKTFLGSMGVLTESTREKAHKPTTLVLDITKAAADLFAKSRPASIRVFERTGSRELVEAKFSLTAKQALIRVQKRR
jgi:hypothetical protein